MSDVTRILAHIDSGDPAAAELAVDSTSDDLFAVDDALTCLAASHPRSSPAIGSLGLGPTGSSSTGC